MEQIAMHGCSLYCLGSPLIESNSKPVKMEMRKSFALLIYLRMGEHPVSRDFLATLFWPEYDQIHAQANLRRALSSLNKYLPSKTLEADRDKIGLINHSSIWLDVDYFHDLYNQLQNHIHADKAVTVECLNDAKKAVNLFRGDFLEGFNLEDCPQFDEWQSIHREGIKLEFGKMLQFLSEQYAHVSDWDQALVYANRWLTLDKLHEPAQRLLMNIENETGKRNASLKRFSDLVKMLHDEIGQEPEPATTDLYQQIRNGVSTHKPEEIPTASQKTPTSHSIEPILKTKLFIPKISKSAIKRDNLIEKIEQGVEGPLTLISAPAGYGKTTLLVEWAGFSRLPVAWFSIDRADNNPNRFMTYLVTALSSLHDGIGNESLDLLQSMQAIPTQTLLDFLLKDLEGLSDNMVLVLDDYHYIETESIHETITYLLEHIPACLHLVIATRVDPPIHLPRIRTKGQVMEIRLNDLRFQTNEVDLLLNQVMRLDLVPKQLAILESRTEGWVVGLQMAGIALTSMGINKEEFIQSFSGSQRHILDYLMDEVLSHQSECIQTFLFKTVILDRLCAPLCNTLMADFEDGVDTTLPLSHPVHSSQPASLHDSQQILEYLEIANLFLIPLDEERRWYRYHHLFSDILLMRLHHANGALEKRLHDRASIWHEQEGMINVAIKHAFTGSDKRRPIQLILKFALMHIGSGDLLTVQQWMNSLAEEEILEHPWLCIYKAWIEQVLNRVSKSASYLDRAENSINPDSKEGKEMLVHINALRSDLAIREGCYDHAGELAHEAYRLLSAEKNIMQWDLLRWTVLILIGYIYFIHFKLDLAEKVYLEAYEFASKINNLYIYTFSIDNLTELYRIQGRLHEAEAIYQKAIEKGSELYGRRTMLLGGVLVYYSYILYEWNNLDQALQFAREGINGAEGLGRAKPWILGYVNLSKILQARGDLAGAGKAIEEANLLIQKNKVPPMNMYTLNFQFRRYKQSTGMMDITAETQQLQLPVDMQQYNVVDFLTQIEIIRLMQIQGRIKESIQILDQLIVLLHPTGMTPCLISALLLQASGKYEIGEKDQALEIFKECVILASPGGFIRTFLDEGPQIERLVCAYQKEITAMKNTSPEVIGYIQKLADAFRLEQIR